jgi:hypothetical protein
MNGLAHVGPRPLADNQDRVHTTTCRARLQLRLHMNGETQLAA